MATEKKIICPLMHTQCIEDGAVVGGELHSCRFWINIVGKHPQTGADVNQGDCSFAWLPVLLIDNTQKQRETGAAVESLRNENVSAATMLANTMLQVSHQAMLAPPQPKEITG